VFWLKKVVSYWLMPLPLCMALIAAGVALLYSQRRSRLGRRLAVCGAVLLALYSNRTVSSLLLGTLESRYPAVPEFAPGAAVPVDLAGCEIVAVLGSGSSNAPGIAATSRLSTSGLGRVVEAVRILSVLPRARLVLCGPGAPGFPSQASIAALAARSLGVDPRRITLIETAHDTEEESRAVAAIAAGRRIALVTSAWHMPRAAALFRKAKANFVPCPADFLSALSLGTPAGWRRLGFDVESLSRSTAAVHEWIGLLWTRIRIGAQA
jgi:uncharacterized SAM-binding protein YcdF (DUF218 family)